MNGVKERTATAVLLNTQSMKAQEKRPGSPYGNTMNFDLRCSVD